MNYVLINEPDKTLSAVEQVLFNRGMPIEKIEHYLNTDIEDIYNPLLLNNMHEGAKMLIKHIAANDNIYVQVD